MASYEQGKGLAVVHGKPWKPGKPYQMQGFVERASEDWVLLTRRFRSPGRAYDGLHADQHAGDHGTIELRRGAWVSRRRYFRQQGALIGELYNIQTPTEFAPRDVRYIDLEIDVAWLPHHPERVLIQDVEDLEKAEAQGHIPREVAELARWVAEELARRLRPWDGRSPLAWDVRPELERVGPVLSGFLQEALL
jgi:hypothetical protein